MATYQHRTLTFRVPDISDVDQISKWLTQAAGMPASWQHRFRKLLLLQWEKTGALALESSWIVLSRNRRVFFLEVAGDDVFITAPPSLQKNPRRMQSWLRDIDAHLRRMGIAADTAIILHTPGFIVPLRRENG